jgi:hypothetical protein
MDHTVQAGEGCTSTLIAVLIQRFLGQDIAASLHEQTQNLSACVAHNMMRRGASDQYVPRMKRRPSWGSNTAQHSRAQALCMMTGLREWCAQEASDHASCVSESGIGMSSKCFNREAISGFSPARMPPLARLPSKLSGAPSPHVRKRWLGGNHTLVSSSHPHQCQQGGVVVGDGHT